MAFGIAASEPIDETRPSQDRPYRDRVEAWTLPVALLGALALNFAWVGYCMYRSLSL